MSAASDRLAELRAQQARQPVASDRFPTLTPVLSNGNQSFTPEGRPVFKDPQGSFVTEKTITITDPRINKGRPTNIPTVFDGRVLEDSEAIELIANAGGKDPVTGRALEGFSSINEAVSSAQNRSFSLGGQLEKASPARARLDELRAAQAPSPQQEQSFLAQAQEAITGAERTAALPEDVQQLPELQSLFAPETGTGFLNELKIGAGLASTFDPEARKDIIKNAIPDVTFEEFEGTTVVNLPNGEKAVINAPGLSTSDIAAGIAQALAFIPSGQLASFGRSLAQRAGIGAAASGATEAALQAGAQALGSEQEIDKGQVATAAALGPVGELGSAAVTGGKRILEAAKQEIPEQVAKALEKGRVFTTDLFPPDSFVGANLQRLAEKIPITGTGPLRSLQQREREQAVRDLAGEFDVDIDTPFEEDIIASATRVFEGAQERAKTFRRDSVEQLVKGGEVNVANAKAIVAEEIAIQKGLGEKGSKSLIDSLEATQTELTGDFKRIGDIRTTVNTEIADLNKNTVLPSSAEAVLNTVRGAITEDMKTFARDFSKTARSAGDKEGAKAFSKWNASNKIFADGFQKAKDSQLKKVLSKGDITPEVALTVVRGGKPSDLKRLNANLDREGKQAVRQTIIRDAIEKAGGLEEINPTKFINELNRPNIRKAANVFFKGNTGKEFEGLKLFLNKTKRAQQAGTLTPTGQELIAPLTGVLLGVASPIAVPVGGAISASARLFESPQIRNLMIKLADTPSVEGRETIIRKLQPLILEESRRSNSQE